MPAHHARTRWLLKIAYLAAIGTILWPSAGFVSAGDWRRIRERLIGYPLRGVGYHYPPVMEAIKRGANVTFQGIGVEFMEILANYFKMNLIIIPANESEINRLGFITALFGLVARKEADLVSYPFQIRVTEYAEYIRFTYPMWIIPHTFLQAWPKEENTRITAPIRPFTSPVWWLFFISVVAMIVVLGGTQYVRRQIYERLEQREPITAVWMDIDQSADYAASVILNQGNYTLPTPWVSNYILVGLWGLSLIVVLNAYTGTLTAFLTVPKLKPTISTIEDLATSPDRMLIVEPDTDFYFKCVVGCLLRTLDGSNYRALMTMISVEILPKNASHGPYKIVGDTLRNNPDNALLDGSFANIFDKIVNHGNIYLTVGALAEYLINQDHKLNGRCRMTTAAKTLKSFANLAVPMTKGLFFYEAFNHGVILRLWEGGVVDSWLKIHFAALPQCHAETAPRENKLTAIKLTDFQAVFLLLGIGVVLSILVFCLELVWSRIVK